MPGDRSEIRATRDYAAGFGSSGSLLAGAAVIFLIGSAIVAWGGWPQIATGPATSSVAAAPLALSSPASRRLTVLLAVPHRPAALGARIRRTAGHVRVSVKGVRIGSGRAQPGGPSGSSGPGGAGVEGGSRGGGGSQCGSCVSPNPASPVTTTVSNLASKVGQQITGLGSTAAGQLNPVSPPAGGAVSSVTSTAANTVTVTVNTVTNAVGGVLGGSH